MNQPLPQSIENECAALGAAILDPRAATKVVKLLDEHDFYRPANREVFRSISEITASGHEIDLPTLTAALDRRGALKRSGDVNYLIELFESVPSAVSADVYAGIVKDLSIRRQAIDALHSATELAYGDIAATDLLDGTIGDLMRLRRTRGGVGGAVGDFVDGALEPIEGSIDYGIPPLDSLIGGLDPGTLHIIGAKPGSGKTQLMIASMIAMGEAGVPCGVISAEMEGAQIGRRFVVQVGGLPMARVRKGELIPEEVERGRAAQAKIKALPLYMDDTPGANVGFIQSQAREWVMAHGIKALFVDYLQLLACKEDDEVGRVTVNVRGLKQVARELGIAVVCLAQINREGMAARPAMHHLKGSSEIEQASSTITLIHRDGQYVELIVVKNREGETGTANVEFDGSTGRFSRPGPLW
jgi:replicative DNA helicase